MAKTTQESEEPKRVVSKRAISADVPPERKPERGYVRMFPRNENPELEGTFACSPGTKTRTRARSPKPPFYKTALFHVYLNSVQQMVSGELAGEGLQRGFSRHGLPPQRAPLDTVYPLREHLNSVQGMVSGVYCEGLLPDTVCWTRLRNTWLLSPSERRGTPIVFTLFRWFWAFSHCFAWFSLLFALLGLSVPDLFGSLLSDYLPVAV